MPKKLRDHLFYTFIALFILGSIIVSLYASGFKINFTWPINFNRLLIRTGMIIIKSEPKGATIYLNKKKQTNFSLNPWKIENLKTPNKIKGVLPGQYELTLKLNGYLDFNKKINVYSEKTTSIENIYLFRNNLPQFIARANNSKLEFSPKRDFLYLPQESKLIDIQNNNYKILLATSSPGIWLNNNKLLNSGRIFNSLGKLETTYPKLINKNLYNWYYDKNENLVYYQEDQTIKNFDFDSRQETEIINRKNILNYEIKNKKIFIITTKKNQSVLQVYSLKTKKIEQEIILPKIAQYNFIPEKYSYLTLYDQQNKTLYLIDPKNITKNLISIKNVVDWQWQNDNSLIYNNNWEIFKLNLISNKSQLLIRIEEKIKKIIWNKNKNYLIFLTDTGLNIYNPQIKLRTKLFSNAEIAHPQLDESNDLLYFWAKIGHQAGIYNLLLQ